MFNLILAFNLSKITLKALCTIILMVLAFSASAKSVNDIIKEYYPIYNKAKQCQGIIANNGSSDGEEKPYQSGYCIEIDRQLKVQTKQGKRLYISIIGDVAFHENGYASFGSHADTGLVGMLVLKPKGSGWEVEYANPAMNAGSFGKGLKDWKLVQVAPDIWGFINIHGDSHSRVSFNEYVILTPDNLSKSIIDSHIGADIEYYNEPTAPSGCSKDRQVKYCELLKAKLDIDKTTVINGYYPLEITVHGYKYNYDGSEKNTYNNQIFRVKYEPKKGYPKLEDYPLD